MDFVAGDMSRLIRVDVKLEAEKPKQLTPDELRKQLNSEFSPVLDSFQRLPQWPFRR